MRVKAGPSTDTFASGAPHVGGGDTGYGTGVAHPRPLVSGVRLICNILLEKLFYPLTNLIQGRAGEGAGVPRRRPLPSGVRLIKHQAEPGRPSQHLRESRRQLKAVLEQGLAAKHVQA